MTSFATLPIDAADATLVGRVRLPGSRLPAVVTIRKNEVVQLDASFLTVADVLEAPEPVSVIRQSKGRTLGAADSVIGNTLEARRPDLPFLLAPCDLQAVKATGVTFIRSLLERLIEEQTKGDPAKADDARKAIESEIGADLASIVPGSKQALDLRRVLLPRGAWSPYLEVGLGPDCELFTKAQPMSAVGTGAEIGIHPQSTWNNPEPEMVLVGNSRGAVIGASLGNDVNLRDFEGRSALLLGRSKDNNGACAIGPFIRLFDDKFTIDDVRSAEVVLEIEGPDGFHLSDTTSMKAISRDPLDIARQSTGRSHPYPDGFVLFLGAMFAPTKDRDEPGRGFTHKVGDLVRISSPRLGTLSNRVAFSDVAEEWTYGLRALLHGVKAATTTTH